MNELHRNFGLALYGVAVVRVLFMILFVATGIKDVTAVVDQYWDDVLIFVALGLLLRKR